MNTFIGQTSTANRNINNLTGGLKNAESTTTASIGNMKKQAMGLAAEYRKAGLTQSEALKKAWSEIERNSKNSNENIKKGWLSGFSDIGKKGINTFNSLNSRVNKFSNSMLGTLSKLTAGYLSLRGAITLTKDTMKAGMEFQNASTFLQATFGQTEGKERFKWAVDEANKTPFSTTEVANGLARANALGLKTDSSSFKMYEDMGSFAKIQGVGDLGSAIDAIVDAQSGEWIRLQTITGIKRAGLEEFAKNNGYGKFTNKKGQVTDKEELMKVLQGYMAEKGIAGMTEKFSKTLSGRFDSLKDNFRNMLANIGGIGEYGEVIDGGLFDKAGKGIEKLVISLDKFGKSESFQRISDGLGKVGNALINGLDYITEHPEVVTNLGKLGIGFAGLKVVTGLISPIARVSNIISSLGSNISSTTNTTRQLSNVLGGGGLSNSLTTLGKSALTATSLIAGGALLLNRLGDKNSNINHAFNDFANGITNKQTGEKADYGYIWSKAIPYSLLKLQKGLAHFRGNTEWENQLNQKIHTIESKVVTRSSELNGIYDTWQSEKDGKKPVEHWRTVSNMISNNEISSTINNTNNNSSASNKTEINLNVDTIRETADIDDIMNQLATKINKINNTRNAIV